MIWHRHWTNSNFPDVMHLSSHLEIAIACLTGNILTHLVSFPHRAQNIFLALKQSLLLTNKSENAYNHRGNHAELKILFRHYETDLKFLVNVFSVEKTCKSQTLALSDNCSGSMYKCTHHPLPRSCRCWALQGGRDGEVSCKHSNESMKANASKSTWRKRYLQLSIFLYSEMGFSSPNPLPLLSQSITSVGKNSILNRWHQHILYSPWIISPEQQNKFNNQAKKQN